MDNRTLPRHNHVCRDQLLVNAVHVISSYRIMSSKKHKKQTQQCPGCHVPKTSHEFSAMGKICKSTDLQPNLKNLYMAHPPAQETMTHELLQAIRSLSSQVAALQSEHQNFQQIVEG